MSFEELCRTGKGKADLLRHLKRRGFEEAKGNWSSLDRTS
jgi:hypothetical protein